MFLEREILSHSGITIEESVEPGKGTLFEIGVVKEIDMRSCKSFYSENSIYNYF